jgi:signal transduction histidine kinase
VIQKGVPLLLGEGDQHDPQYDSFGHSTTLSHAETGAEASATYILTVYPTEVMFEEFNTSIPMIAAIGFAAVIFFCTCIFFLYDYFMQYETHQHKKILEVKRRFVRFISHEIRTPMNVVCMGLDLLQAELQDKLKKEKHQKLMLPSRKTSGVEPAEDDTKNAQQDEMQDEETTTNYWIGLIQEILENSHNAVSVLNDLLNYDKVC